MSDYSIPEKSYDKISELHKSLIKALAETKDIHWDAKNPFHKNKYATLSAHLSELKPIFAKHSLAILQLPYSDNGFDNHTTIGIKTIIIHANGESIESKLTVPITPETSGQQSGALLTYLRRYCLAMVAGVATEDDDAEIDRQARPTSATTGQSRSGAVAPQRKFEVVEDTPVSQTSSTPLTSGDIDPQMPVPFGNNKGTPIGDLQGKDLEYWATKWEPRPWEKTGKVSPKDAKLKATAVDLYENANGSTPAESSDEVPF